MTKSVAAGLAAYESDADLRAARIRMGAAVPETGWLADYLRAVTPLTDAPVEFHLASGLAAIAGAVGNRLWAQTWGQNVFPHLWTVLVAPSSFWRKSTSINQAEGLLREAAPDAVFPSDFSREKLLGILAKQPSGMLTLKEFGGFLALLGRDYMSGMRENLTELYDGPDLFSRALQSAQIEIRRPAITLLGATTLDWLEGRITEGDLQGGFLARYLFVTATVKASAKGLTTGMDGMVRMHLRDALHDMHMRIPLEVVYVDAAREQLDDWMQGWEAEVTASHHRADLSGFAVRLQTYAIKLAMLYRQSAVAGEDDADWHHVDESSVGHAIAYCRLLWRNVAALIDDQIAITKDAKELRRVRSVIGSGITRSDALRLSKLKARDFDQYLDTLVQGGEIHVVKAKASVVGLDRSQDRVVTWLAPGSGSANGQLSSHSVHSVPADSVQLSSHSVPGEPSESGNYGELRGTELGDSEHESQLSSQFSSSLLDPYESGAPVVGGRAREGSEAKRVRKTAAQRDAESIL